MKHMQAPNPWWATCLLGVVLVGQSLGAAAGPDANKDPASAVVRKAVPMPEQAPPHGPRDPTAMPAEAAQALPAGVSAALPQGSSVLMQGGKPFLVVGTRLVAVGQKVGNARLERITETEIWLREGTRLSKLSRFAGIERRIVLAPVAPAVPQGAASAVIDAPACTRVPSPTPSARQAPAQQSPGRTAAAARAVPRTASCDGAQP